MAKNAAKKKKKGRLKKIVLILLVLVLLAAGGMFFLRMRMPGASSIAYASYTATTGTISNSLSFSGSLQLIDSETATANAKSTVREVYVAEGDDVLAGDRLMRLNNGQIVEASFNGRVNQLYVSAGEEVAAGDSLVQVADFTHMKVAVNVDEYDIGDVSVGTACQVSTTATEQQYDSTISSINYISSSGGSVAYYTATAYVDVGEGVYPGMQVTLTIPQEEAKDVVVLNINALSFDMTNQAYVLMQDEDGTMQQVYVTTGVSNGNYVEISEGLSSGDVVYAISTDSDSSSSLAGLFNMGGFGGGGMSMPSGGGNIMEGGFSQRDGGGTRPSNGNGSGGGSR